MPLRDGIKRAGQPSVGQRFIAVFGDPEDSALTAGHAHSAAEPLRPIRRQIVSFADKPRSCRVTPEVIRCQTSRPVQEPVPSIVPSDIPAMSDDECLVRLAQAVADHDSAHLDEVARLIGRLAVTIE